MSHPMWQLHSCRESAKKARVVAYRIESVKSQSNYSEGFSMVSAKFCADVLTVPIDAFVWGGTETSAQL